MKIKKLNDKINLYLGDCLKILPTLEDKSMDAVITDPPFGIGFVYNGNQEVANTPEKYWIWYAPIHAEIQRVLKDGGFWATWQSTPYMRYFWDWFGDDIHIYIGAKNFVQLRKTPINYSYDPIVMGYKSGAKALRPEKPKRNVDYFVSNTAALVSNPSRIERQHPTPRPIDLMMQIVSNFSIDGGTVFDPFMGSGSTGVACVQLGRSFIGIEKEPKYFKIAQTRIAEAQMQMEEKHDKSRQ